MKISVLKPIAFSILASAVLTACSSGGDSGEKSAIKSCAYNIQGGNTVDIMFGTAYTNPSVKVTQEGEDVSYEVEGSVDTSKLGESKITYTGEQCSNQQIRTVNVVASSCAYKLNGSNPLEVLLDETYNELGAEVKDINNNNIEYNITGTVNTSKEDSYVLTYQGAGCNNSQKRTVKVKAKTTTCQYQLKGNSPLVIALNGQYSDLGVTALNAKGETIEKVTVSGDSVNTKVAANYEVSYQGEGCSNDIKRKVIVKASTECTFELQGNNPHTFSLGSDYSELGFKIKDPDGNTITTGTSTNNIDKNKIGQYEVTYQDLGCKNTAIRTINVIAANCTYSFAENTNPLVILKGDKYIDVKPTVKSATGKEIANDAIIVKSNTIDVNTLKDDYEVIYEASSCPNTGVRQVMVKLPTCTYQFPDGKQTVDLIAGQNYISPKVTIEGMPDVKVSILDGEVNKSELGMHTITYGAKGVCANTTNYIVNVKKITDEELKALKDKIGKTILPKI